VRLSGRLKNTRQHPLPQDLREVHIIIDTGKKLCISQRSDIAGGGDRRLINPADRAVLSLGRRTSDNEILDNRKCRSYSIDCQ
jgi:hypothetical protein